LAIALWQDVDYELSCVFFHEQVFYINKGVAMAALFSYGAKGGV
jgi:hypothetical protein